MTIAPPDNAELRDELSELINGFIAATMKFASTREKRAFDRGWDAAMKWISERAKEEVNRASHAPPPPKPLPGASHQASPPPPAAVPVPPQTTASSVAAAISAAPQPAVRRKASTVVLDAINRVPGQRGVELFQYIEMMESEDYPERTLRTALHRLKKRGLIEIVEGRWYPVKDATSTPLLDDEEEDQ